MKEYARTDKYDRNFLNQNMMGPNSMLIAEELLSEFTLEKGQRVLDLGCGGGLTSVFLAKEYGVQVFAVDLWISATENLEKFRTMGVDDIVIPLQLDAHAMPFADGYFDAVISVDSYHYFGNNDEFFNKCLRRVLKKNALVALAFPGMKYEVQNNIPHEMKPLWDSESLEMWHSIDWWKGKLSNLLVDFQIKEMECFDRAWSDWLECENPYAVEDREMIATDNGRYMNLISLTGKAI